MTRDYLNRCQKLLETVAQQTPMIEKAADVFAQSILAGRMVHLFGSG
ncbi:MAG: SIS domain-containing protein, partial [Verrucomicrobiota bacterium]